MDRDHECCPCVKKPAPVPHLAPFTNGWTSQPVTGAQHRRWMAEHDAAIGYGLLGPKDDTELTARK